MDNNYIIRQVSKFFNGANCTFEYGGIIITLDKECAYFFINDIEENEDNINEDNRKVLYIDKLYKCSLSGNQILEAFDILVEQLNKDNYNIKYITLTDASYIMWESITFKTKINLAKLKIISNGTSWYNSKGYIKRILMMKNYLGI